MSSYDYTTCYIKRKNTFAYLVPLTVVSRRRGLVSNLGHGVDPTIRSSATILRLHTNYINHLADGFNLYRAEHFLLVFLLCRWENLIFVSIPRLAGELLA